jgi:hypothetical protein
MTCSLTILTHPHGWPYGFLAKEIMPHDGMVDSLGPTCGKRTSLLSPTSPSTGQGVGFVLSVNYGNNTLMINEKLLEFT